VPDPGGDVSKGPGAEGPTPGPRGVMVAKRPGHIPAEAMLEQGRCTLARPEQEMVAEAGAPL
jgi:hypothetical protein